MTVAVTPCHRPKTGVAFPGGRLSRCPPGHKKNLPMVGVLTPFGCARSMTRHHRWALYYHVHYHRRCDHRHCGRPGLPVSGPHVAAPPTQWATAAWSPGQQSAQERAAMAAARAVSPSTSLTCRRHRAARLQGHCHGTKTKRQRMLTKRRAGHTPVETTPPVRR